MPSARYSITTMTAALLLACATSSSAEEDRATQTGAAVYSSKDRLIERGRYIVAITGCNDCHTPGYAERGGDIPESQWLVGDSLGWRGPWGTTYASNLRLYMHKLSEEEWIEMAQTAKLRPPMPAPSLHRMTEVDLRAIYAFVRHLGPAGEPAPSYAPPDQEPRGPYVLFPEPPKQAIQ